MLNGFGVVGTQNYYYGIRRFPKARMSFTGGPNNRPHNPMTFADIDSNQINVTNGAYPAMAGPHISTTADQVHAAGEIWSSALWEVRCQMVGRLGFAAGTQKVLQAVTDGMKLDPVNPTFLQSRDSIIAAASAFPIAPEAGADAADVREGFRIRGMGFSASIQSGNGSPARVTEAFDVANVTIIDPFSVSDTPGDNDGFPEPGENVLLNVSVTNTTGNTLNGVVANVTGGGSANYGSITNGQTKTMAIAYTVPANVPCGSLHTVTLNVNSTEVPAFNTVTRSFRVGTPVGGAPVTFSNNTATVINDGATGAPAASTPYGTTINVSGLTGNKTMKLGITNFTHTFPGDVDMLLVGPAGQKMIPYSDVVGGTDAVNISFKMVDTATDLLPAAAALVNGAEYKPSDVTSGDTFPAPAPAAPYLSAAPVGSSTFNSVYGTSGAALNGTWTLYMVDDAGQDTGTTGGWSLTFEANDFDCNIGPQTGNSDARADFDGDGKSDLSVFRPGTGIWYMNRSQAGFAAVNWGIAGDTPVPGDYDGDDKTDPAIYRPSNTAGVPDFYVLKSSTGTVTGAEFGLVGDVPVVGDYNGDDIDDYSVYRASTGIWYTMTNTGAVTLTNVGTTGTPVSGDFNGDDISDIAMFNAGTWTIRLSGGATITPTWGQAGDKLVPADYDGDGKDDLAVFRNGQWLIHGSAGVDSTVNWGVAGDIPVPGNYDGDTKEDVAIYRNGTWYVNGSTSGIQITAFGLGSDTAIESKYQQ
jgi:subtilisin-like proprotein convertase family protein